MFPGITACEFKKLWILLRSCLPSDFFNVGVSRAEGFPGTHIYQL